MDFSLQNDGHLIHNDMVLGGESFSLFNIAFLFKIRAKTPYWRFGLRLSETPEIEFFHPEDRYQRPGFDRYKDVHLGVGEWNNANWMHPNRISLAQYNFDYPRHLLDRKDNYKENGWVEFYVQSIPGRQGLFVSYVADGCEPFSGFLPLDTAFRYFKVFAWADNIAFDLDCNYSAISTDEIDNNTAPFKMGNLVFRLGDMFNRDALSNANLIILPAATIGTVTPNISNRAAELRIPSAPRGTAGNIKIFKVDDGGSEFYAGYAYSVKVMSTTANIIRKLCEQLIKTVRRMDKVSGVNLPLLGTGAGQLEPVEVAEIFNRELNQP
ncbi:MAG: hypothetical protein ABI203_01540, partial [Mucilaginibacter sp.]